MNDQGEEYTLSSPEVVILDPVHRDREFQREPHRAHTGKYSREAYETGFSPPARPSSLAQTWADSGKSVD
jgi:hypothetical protein